jgi:hypothetical protein
MFTLESGHWPGKRRPADLYPKAPITRRPVLFATCAQQVICVPFFTFHLDSRHKMPVRLATRFAPRSDTHCGADILRLWALSVDSPRTHRQGNLAAGDQYRAQEHRYLSALEGFRKERLRRKCRSLSAMLALTAHLDVRLAGSHRFDFNTMSGR